MIPRYLSKKDLAGWALLLALSAVLFQRTFSGLWMRWTDWADGTYSHGLLVPLFSLFFVYDNWERIKETPVGGSLWGVPALAASLAMFFAGVLGNMLFAQAVAFIFTLLSLALLLGGWRFLKVTALPIAFLIFMCPLPSGLYDRVSAGLRLFASGAATTLLQILDVTAIREGNIIRIPGNTLSVEDACSGIRSLFGITATATAFAFIVPGGFIRKTVFILSAIPIAVFSNILRVVGTGLLHYYGNAALAEGFYHYLEGWVFYVMALALLFLEFYLLRAIFPMQKAPGQDKAQETGGAAE